MAAGEYIPGDSPLHKAHPITKVVLMFLLIFMLFTTFNVVYAFLITCFIFGLYVMSGIPFGRISTMIKVSLPLIIFVLATQSIISSYTRTFMTIPNTDSWFPMTPGYPHDPAGRKLTLIPDWFPIGGGFGYIGMEGFTFGVNLSFRLLSFILLMTPIVVTTPVTDMILALTQMRIPYTYAFITTTALRFVPIIQENHNRILNAQKLRGLDLEKAGFLSKMRAYIPLFVPLIVSAMKMCEELEVAIESRAFSTDRPRTYYKELPLSKWDKLAIAIMIAYFPLHLWILTSPDPEYGHPKPFSTSVLAYDAFHEPFKLAFRNPFDWSSYLFYLDFKPIIEGGFYVFIAKLYLFIWDIIHWILSSIGLVAAMVL